jgi:folate-binding protein YgfZ
VTDTFAQIAIVGPDAARIVSSVIQGAALDTLSALAEHGSVRTDWQGQPAIVVRVTDTGEPGFDVFVDHRGREALIAAASAAGATRIDDATAEVLRIEAGVPLFHRDMDEETIPLEAGIESRAINFNKGCYVGQEVIIRVLHRGHGRVARKLVGLVLADGEPPNAGATVRGGDKEIGHVTSSAMSPALQRPIALAYVHRDYVEPGTAVQVDGVDAIVTALPFVGTP